MPRPLLGLLTLFPAALAAVAPLLLATALLTAHAAERKPTAAEALIELVNLDRTRQGLPRIALSPSLTLVAEAHVRDLERRRPSGRCNPHSWSATGNWSACCYTGDHAQAQCMWNKPREITAGRYPGLGFEILAWHSRHMTPAIALNQWRRSSLHHDLIVNQGTWTHTRWQAVGAAVSKHYAVVWFGREPDDTDVR